MMRSALRAAAALMLLIASVPAVRAARPMATDDARIVDAKACQLESWVRRDRDATGLWALPACNPGGNLEITAGGAQTREDGKTRLTDEVLQAKTLFRPLDRWGIGLAVGTTVHPRQPSSRAWPGDPYFYVPVTFEAAGERWVVHVNAGATRDRDAARTVGTWGVGNEIRLGEKVYAIAETFSTDRGRPFYQAGLRTWIVKDRVQVDATCGDRVGTRQGKRWVSVGLRLLAPPFLP